MRYYIYDQQHRLIVVLDNEPDAMAYIKGKPLYIYPKP